MADVQLLLTDDANRRALASLVEKRHTAITATEFRDADLYLVDDASLSRYRDALEAHKRDLHPVFCPVVLIRRRETTMTVELSDPDPDERPLLVNEVLTAPVDGQTMFRRVSNLLVRRHQTTSLREANERLERFADILRHELRNPLNILDGYLVRARERDDPSAFDRCERAVDRMMRLLEESELVIAGGSLDVDAEAVDLAAACGDCWQAIPSAAVQLRIETTRSVVADRDRLAQLLENLFRNAVEHGGDDGTGISADEREAVFEAGYSTATSGSGLGLAVVDTVADLHGADVRVTASEAGGARFEMTGFDGA
ncbi:MAG: sensor histidine kinase [Haloglomus sp.]